MSEPTRTTAPRPRVLIVDDDHEIRRLLLRFLERETEFELFDLKDAQQLNLEVATHQIDLVVLDVFLPGVNGYDALRSLREHSPVPVIILTAAGEIEDRLQGLDLGADDYMVKPFDPRELLARIRNLLARSYSLAKPEQTRSTLHRWTLAGFEIDLRQQKLRHQDGHYQTLSERERRLMELFLRNPMKPLSRDYILREVFGGEDAVVERAVDVLVSRLRKRFGAQGQELITSIRGSGYVLRAEPTLAPPEHPDKH
jgi:two-component system OmpR family response regulator